MSFVDDVRRSFDALEFSTAINTVVRDGRPTPAALQDADLVTSAVTALDAFASNASDTDPPDVVAAYLDISPSASEIFSTLALSTRAPSITLSALDCLTAIAHYADCSKPPSVSVLAARSVVKDVVKARAASLYEVFSCKSSRCARKALKLLNAVVAVHPLLAKELINRFDLTSLHFAPSLCTPENHLCRAPFLRLITSLVDTKDFDVLKYLATKGRRILVACVTVISTRLKLEHDYESNESVRKLFTIMASNVQQRELNSAIAFLRAFHGAYIVSSNVSDSTTAKTTFTIPGIVRRGAFSFAVFSPLVAIASSAPPPLSVVPRQATMHNEQLRQFAAEFVSAVVADTAAISAETVASAVANARPSSSPSATQLALRLAREHPRIASQLLRFCGAICGGAPRLNSAWLGGAAVLAEALIRSDKPVEALYEGRMLEMALTNSSGLVRHVGATLLLAHARLVERDADAIKQPHRFLPARTTVHKYALGVGLGKEKGKDYKTGEGEGKGKGKGEVLRKVVGVDFPKGDLVAHRLLAIYQRIFGADDKNRDMVHMALVSSGSDFTAADDVLRLELAAAPGETVSKVMRRKYLSSMLEQATGTYDAFKSEHLWTLAADVIKAADLFPQSTSKDVHILLAILSSYRAEKLRTCTVLLENVIVSAVDKPYGLFDELHGVNSGEPNTEPRASLLAVACLIRLRKLCAVTKGEGNVGTRKRKRNDDSNSKEADVCRTFLRDVLLAHVAFDEVVSGHVPRQNSYLIRELEIIFSADELWWKPCAGDKNFESEIPARPEACEFVRRLLNHKMMLYPAQPYLTAARFSCQFREALASRGMDLKNGDVGSMWKAAQELKDSQKVYDAKADPGVVLYGGELRENLFDWNECAGVLLATEKVFPVGVVDAKAAVKRLREVLDYDNFVVALCVILRTTQNINAWRAAFRSLIRDMSQKNQENGNILNGESTKEEKGNNGEPLWVFRRESVLSACQRHRELDEVDVDRVMKYICERFNGMGRTRKKHENRDGGKSSISSGPELEYDPRELAFCLRFLKVMVFHEHHRICTCARLLLQSVHSLKRFPDVKTLQVDCAYMTAAVVPYFPALRALIWKQLSKWNMKSMELEYVIDNDSKHMVVSSGVVQLISSVMMASESKTDDDVMEDAASCRRQLADHLIRNSFISIAGSDSVGEKDSMNSGGTLRDFFDDKATIMAISDLDRLSGIQGSEHIICSSLKSSMSLIKERDIKNEIPTLLFRLYGMQDNQHAGDTQSLSHFNVMPSYKKVLTIFTDFLTVHQIDSSNPTHLATVSLLRTFLTHRDHDLSIDSGTHLLDKTLNTLIEKTTHLILEDERNRRRRCGTGREICETESVVFEEMMKCLPLLINLGTGRLNEILRAVSSIGVKKWACLQRRMKSNEDDDENVERRTKKRREHDGEKLQKLFMMVCDFLISVLGRLDRELDEWLKHEDADVIEDADVESLFIVRKILCEKGNFEALLCEHDVKVKMTIRAIDSFMRLECVSKIIPPDISSQLQHIGVGKWNPDAATVLNSFSHSMLESARENIFNWYDEGDDVNNDVESAHLFHMMNYQSLSKEQLSSTSYILWPSASTSLEQIQSDCNVLRRFDEKRKDKENNYKNGMDSEFILRTFLAACAQAQQTPEAPVLDLGKIAKDGILAVALTAISGPNRRCRLLGYACIQLFSEVIGAVSGVPGNHASGLYRDRKQLAFVLGLLRQSIVGSDVDVEQVKVLPLFIAWFVVCIKVALQSVHDVNKIVTSLLLREERWDVMDCTGLVHLLNCGGVEREVRAARELGLEVLSKGLRGWRDWKIARKRMMIEHVMMLAGGVNGVDHEGENGFVRMKAIGVVENILKRGVGIAREFCEGYGVVSWVCVQHGMKMRKNEVLKRMSVLQRLVESGVIVGNDVDDEKEGMKTVVMDSFTIIAGQACQRINEGETSTKILGGFVRCASAMMTHFGIARLGLFNVDFANWYSAVHGRDGNKGNGKDLKHHDNQSELWRFFRPMDVANIIARQCEERVGNSVIRGMLHARIESEEKIHIGIEGSEDWVNVLAIDCFIARCLIRMVEDYDVSDIDGNCNHEMNSTELKMIVELVARVLMSGRTSVWIVVAGLAVLTLAKKARKRSDKEILMMEEELVEVAGMVPGDVPYDKACEKYAKRFESVTKRAAPVVSKALLKYC